MCSKNPFMILMMENMELNYFTLLTAIFSQSQKQHLQLAVGRMDLFFKNTMEVEKVDLAQYFGRGNRDSALWYNSNKFLLFPCLLFVRKRY